MINFDNTGDATILNEATATGLIAEGNDTNKMAYLT